MCLVSNALLVSLATVHSGPVSYQLMGVGGRGGSLGVIGIFFHCLCLVFGVFRMKFCPSNDQCFWASLRTLTQGFSGTVNVIIIEGCYFFHIHFSSFKEDTQSFKEGACQTVLGSDSS